MQRTNMILIVDDDDKLRMEIRDRIENTGYLVEEADNGLLELEKVRKAGSEILKICADAGGTISGEHGIGIEKLKETALIFSDTDMEFLRLIKKAFDPQDIWNPGKLVPPDLQSPH